MDDKDHYDHAGPNGLCLYTNIKLRYSKPIDGEYWLDAVFYKTYPLL